jgi:hypothetical protein
MGPTPIVLPSTFAAAFGPMLRTRRLTPLGSVNLLCESFSLDGARVYQAPYEADEGLSLGFNYWIYQRQKVSLCPTKRRLMGLLHHAITDNLH